MWLHGELLITSVDEIPTTAWRKTNMVIARNKEDGSAHRVMEGDSAEIYQIGRETYLNITAATATIIHEAYYPITLPQGAYHIWKQRH